jgi:hypothetical protein
VRRLVRLWRELAREREALIDARLRDELIDLAVTAAACVLICTDLVLAVVAFGGGTVA